MYMSGHTNSVALYKRWKRAALHVTAVNRSLEQHIHVPYKANERVIVGGFKRARYSTQTKRGRHVLLLTLVLPFVSC